MKKKNDDSAKLRELRKRAEASLRISDEGFPNISPEKIRDLVHECRTYQIELELQNEELRHAEEELLESREKYSDLYDFAPVGYITVNEKEMIVESNLTFASMLGIEQRRIINQPLSAYIADEDQDAYYLCHKKTRETKEQQTCELRIKCKEDRNFWAWIEIKVFNHFHSGANNLYLAVIDISELKKRQEELDESVNEVTLNKTVTSVLLESAQAAQECQVFEEAARKIFDAYRKATGAISGCVALLSKDGNENEIQFLEDGDLPCIVDTEFLMPIREFRAEIYRHKKIVYENDFKNSQWMEFMPEGHDPLDNVLFAPLIHNGRAVGLIGFANKPGGFTDSDAKIAMVLAQQAAISLRLSRMVDEMIERDRILNQTGKMAKIGGWEHDLKTGKGIWTEALYDIIEIEPGEEPPGPDEHLNYYPLEHRKTLEDAYQRSSEDGTTFDLELQVNTKKKNLLWCRAYGEPVFHEGKCVKMRGTFQDITDRKQTQIDLEESEQRYCAIFNNMSDGVAIYEAIDNAEDFIFRNINKSGARIGKVSVDEVIGCRVTDVFPGIKDMGLFEVFQQVFRTGKPLNYPISLYKDNKVTHWVENYVCKLPSGEIVSIYEDVTNRKQAEDKLHAQTAFLASLLFSIPSPVFYKDKECRYVGCNPAFEEITGEKLPDIIGKTVFDLWTNEYSKIDNDKDTELIRNPGIQQYESQYETPDGIVRDFIYNKSTYFDQRGEVAGIIGIIQDITERKKSERVARESAKYTRSILDSLTSHIAIVNKHGIIESVNQAWRNFAEENPPLIPNICEGANYFSVCDQVSGKDADQAQKFSQGIREALSGEIYSYQMEYPCHSAEEKRWFTGRITPFQGDSQNRVVVSHENITERKIAEQALRETAQRERQAVQAANVGLWNWNLATNQVHYSVEWKKQIGYEDHEIGNSFQEWQSRVHPDDLKPTLEYINKMISERVLRHSAEFRFRHKDGTYLWILTQASLIMDEHDQPVRVMGSHLVITERKQAENLIRDTIAKMHLAMECADEGIWEWDFKTGLVTFDKMALQMLGYGPEMPQKPGEWWIEQIHSDEMSLVKQRFSSFISGDLDEYSVEFRLKRNNGNYTWVSSNAKIIRSDHMGNPLLLIGIHRDITERKQAENSLQDSEQRLRSIFEQAAVGVALVAIDGKWLRVNNTLCKIVGYTLKEMQKLTFQDITHPDDLETDLDYVRELLNGEIDTYSMEKRYFHKNGSTVWINLTVSLVLQTSGKPDYFISVIENIATRKQAENALRDNVERLRTIYDSAQDGILIADAETHQFVDANNKLCDMLGYSVTEICELGVSNIHPAVSLDYVIEQFEKQLRGEMLLASDLPVKRKDGTVFYADINSTAITLQDKPCLMGIFRDVTERKRLTREIEKSHSQLHALAESLITIREEEQTRIARELHDQLGHALTGLKMDLTWLNKRIPDIQKEEQFPMIQSKITGMLNVTDETVKSVRHICTELRPGMLDNLGLIPTIEWELQEFQKRTGIQYDMDVLTPISLDSHRGTIIYQIVQEALTNVIRHAQASKVSIFIVLEDGILIIEIADNGRGISETELADFRSLGLLGMQERATMIGGTVTVTNIGHARKGTTVRIMVPVKEEG